MRFLRLVVVVVALVGCGAPAPYALDDLVSDLEGAGAEIGIGETKYWSLYRTDGTDLTVNGVEVRVNEYRDEASRIATSDTISMANWSVNATPVEFIATPHFWPKGRILVQYLGDDPDTIGLLTDFLGPEVR